MAWEYVLLPLYGVPLVPWLIVFPEEGSCLALGLCRGRGRGRGRGRESFAQFLLIFQAYQRGRMITQEQLDLIRAYDKKDPYVMDSLLDRV